MTKQKLPKLPKAGDTSNAAIGQRLAYVRQEAGYPVSRAKWFADAEPSDWRKWEKGKTSIPPRNAWIAAMNLQGPVEWLLTGHWTQHPAPAVLPVLGDDLSGFAARVKEARQRLGITIADVEKVHMRRFGKREWLRWEAAEDEPDCANAALLAEFLDVSLEWLLTDTEPGNAAKAGKRYQSDVWLGDVPNSLNGAQLKLAREAAGLTVKDVALLTEGITAKALAQLESGKSPPIRSCDYALTFATLYGVPLETLLYPEDELANVRRRVERLRRRFGLPGPSSKADAA